MSEKQRAVETICTAYRGGRSVALLFDYDGTLVPIVAHPSLAVIPRRVRDLLEELARQPRVAVGILSGRKLDELKSMVGLAGIYYAGTAGLEVDLRGKVLRTPAATAGHIQELLRPLQEAVTQFPGAWVENKGLALTVHYRDVDATLAPVLQAKVVSLLQPMQGRVAEVTGPMAIEIYPDLGRTKGTALHKIVEHVGPETFPVFAGDAGNDEDALEAALALGGMALWVGAGRPAHLTCCQLQDPADVVEFLALLATQLAN